MLQVVSACLACCSPACLVRRVHVWSPRTPPPPDRGSPRPLISAADAAELPGRAQWGRKGPGVAEHRLPHEPGAELQLAGRTRRHHWERENKLVPRGPRYTQHCKCITMSVHCRLLFLLLHSCLNPLTQVWHIYSLTPTWSIRSPSIWTPQRGARVAERSAEEGTWDLSWRCRQRLRLPPALSAHRQLEVVS